MALSSRLRSHPPSMFTDEVLMELDPLARLTGLGLRHYVDDEGRGSARPALIRGQLWPLHPEVTDAVVEEHLVALEDAGFLQLYTEGERTYLVLEEWPSVDRGTKSRLPEPPAPDASRASREDLATSSRAPRETFAVVEGERGERKRGREGERGGESEGVGERGAATSPPGEPSPFCSKHQPYGTEQKCGPCGTARRAHDRWVAEHTDSVTSA